MKPDLMGELDAGNAHQLIVEVQAASPRAASRSRCQPQRTPSFTMQLLMQLHSVGCAVTRRSLTPRIAPSRQR
jgi:hypothetical protein